MRIRAVAIAGTAVLACLPAAAAATTTLDRTIKVEKSDGFRALSEGPGEPHKVRQNGLGRAEKGRQKRRRSLMYFSQLTDPQIADEMSPARVELFDPASGAFSAAWRPQEAVGTQVLDEVVRSVNANKKSPVRDKRGRSRLEFAITTGDTPDNQQLNEVAWFQTVLDGGQVSPFSGQPISDSNPCPSADEAQTAQLNAAVAAREYTGVQDFGDYPGAPNERYAGFWDPDEATPGGAPGPYDAYPRYPGLMDRAQQSFAAKGLDVPWYVTRGNHDGLIQGNLIANDPLFTGLAVGCQKVFPNASFDPATLEGQSSSDIAEEFQNPAVLASLFAGFRTVPPDPDRRFVSVTEYKQLLDTGDEGHGYDYVNKGQEKNSAGTAAYYSFSPAKGVRLISLDTLAEGGGDAGNVDDPQYQWLEKELGKYSSTRISKNGRVRHDDGKDRLIIVYGHHTIQTMNNPNPDEDAGPCSTPPLPGCDADPRDSQPIHLGQKGKQSIEDLLLSYPNVIAAVTGHTHHNNVQAYKRSKPKGGFWEINTASHVDFPQQSRLLELMDNRDGTLSLFGTVVDHSAPIDPPAPGPATNLSDRELASLSRQLAANDPQRDFVTTGNEGGTGDRADRNVELVIKDPRELAK